MTHSKQQAASTIPLPPIAIPPQRVKRGRPPKLTADQVLAIRIRYARGEATHRELAQEYGVCRMAVSKVISGKSWPEVPMVVEPLAGITPKRRIRRDAGKRRGDSPSEDARKRELWLLG